MNLMGYIITVGTHYFELAEGTEKLVRNSEY